ncbi:DUF397 domain-containing protein [Saccharopolyspora endophytica]|uniref:DUF397 domain-containing protein n=1 Tax=Saccharopolyspora endophytica TaxID=543886 RepID=A0ABS5DJS7_9PSEU|nr:DUF397 domain-containing protein [Saccharopolyspora endophytica]MBQ0926547.1 DUF397 domain-containing protein [Saccharopolyspora endophytica]
MTAPDRNALQWRKSTRSSNYANCVEVAFAGDTVHTRDSKNPAGQHLMFGQPAWSSFVQGLRDDRFVSPFRR